MINTLIGLLGIASILGIVWLFSQNKKDINYKGVLLAFVSQLVLAATLILTPAWKLVEWVSSGFSWLLAQSNEGIMFVFGGVSEGFVFFINSLLPIVYISALMGALFHYGIIQKFIEVVAGALAKFLKVSKLSSANFITNMFLGQSDALMVTKSYIPKMSNSILFGSMVGGMASISVSVLGLYQSFGAEMEYLVLSMPLMVFSTFILTQLFMPTQYEEMELELENDREANVLGTMMSYANTGFKVVIGISVALMVFISLVFTVNNLIGMVFPSITIQTILGVFFYPLAFLMGVPFSEVSSVAELLATKLALNEAVAYSMPQFSELSESTKAMTTVALAGFTGFGSIGIMLGSMVGIAPNRVSDVAKLGVKALAIATLVNIFTGTVVGLFL